MNKDKKEKNRKLSEAEKRRLARYEELSEKLISEGYKRTELTVSIVGANIFAFAYGIPLFVVMIIIFLKLHPESSLFTTFFHEYIGFVVALFALIVVHELIHGVTWSLFTPHHFRDIEFGFMKEYLTPYCTCGVPLSKGKYIIGALMPGIILGLLPMITALVTGWGMWLFMGIIMTMSAGGDVLIVINILKYKSQSDDVLYIDHPTQAGGVIFEK